MKSFLPLSESVQQVVVPDDMASSFATVADLESYVSNEMEVKGLSNAEFRLPAHLVPLAPKPQVETPSSSQGSAICSTSHARTTRRTVLAKASSVALVASLLTLLGWTLPQDASAGCGCKVRRRTCQYSQHCIQGNRTVEVEYSYTYDSLGGCDVYCSSRVVRQIRCGC